MEIIPVTFYKLEVFCHRVPGFNTKKLWTLQFGSYLGEKKMWQQMLSSNCSVGHVSPWGPAEVLLCLRIKNIYGSVDRNDQSFCLGPPA